MSEWRRRGRYVFRLGVLMVLGSWRFVVGGVGCCITPISNMDIGMKAKIDNEQHDEMSGEMRLDMTTVACRSGQIELQLCLNKVPCLAD
jgi:hypothetical protein